MLKSMSQEDFELLEDSALAENCFEPIIPMIRGKKGAMKKEVYDHLTTGQKALFMFSAFYNHARNSFAEFYWWSAYFVAQPETWSELKWGLRHLGTDKLLHLIEEIEVCLLKMDFPRSLENFQVTYNDLDYDSSLYDLLKPLHDTFHELGPETLQIIGNFIRMHKKEFITFDSEIE
ncbi:hypothetical protein [Peribacillus sp. SCS-155]|uniref:hypothetical protein n=1 Tax=Peribacillus sedimenti TaxID=3115297 RepID=UPI003906A36B